jgi:ATP-dependent DNA ligase
MLKPPVELMRLEAVTRIPALRSALWQPKVDGWRCAVFVDEAGVQIQARSGRIVTAQFPELVRDLAALPAGTVVDGELVAWRVDDQGEQVLDFAALARTPARRRMLGVTLQLVGFDLLCRDGADVRGLPLAERWPQLHDVLDGAPPTLQPIVSTEDRAEGETWAEALIPRGFEGIVGKRLGSTYGQPRAWFKQRYADTIDAEVVGIAGVSALRVRLDTGRVVTTQPLAPRQVHQLADELTERLEEAGPLRVEVRAGVGRHGTVTFVRVRPPE